MNIIHSLDIINQHVAAANDNKLSEAWQQVINTFVQRAMPFPPTALGGSYHAATKLTDHLCKTGLAGEWDTPPRHSKAMEELIYRLTALLERVTDVVEEATPEVPFHMVDDQHFEWPPNPPATAGEFGWCDCGAGLNRQGDCITGTLCPATREQS